MTIGLDMVFLSLVMACYATSKNIEGCSRKLVMGHGRGTADGGVRWEVGQGDFGIVPNLGDGTFPNDFFDLVKQGLSGLGDDVAEYDMRRIEGIDDIDRAISDISSDLGSQTMAALSPAAALANSAVHACACVIASHPGTMLGCSLSRRGLRWLSSNVPGTRYCRSHKACR